MDPLTIMAIMAIAAEGTSSVLSSQANRKLREKDLEEAKKKRRGDLASSQIERSMEGNIDYRKGMQDIAQNRSMALQDLAQNIRLGMNG